MPSKARPVEGAPIAHVSLSKRSEGMSTPAILLVCPNCEKTCRTRGETRHGANFRCPGCQQMFSFVVHNNGAVELRPADEEPATESRLPPRVKEQGENQGTRRIFTSRRRNRPIGGYAPFEKSRSYIGTFAFFTILGLGAVVVTWYVSQIDTIAQARGRTGANAWQSYDEGKRKEFQARQKRAMENLKKLQAKAQSGGPKLEDGRLPGARTQH
jgi:hypothetical protein